MKQFVIREFGIENLVVVESERPSPSTGEVLVRMRAVSLNYRDLMVIQGQYDPRMRRPIVPSSDACGIVEEVGPDVTRYQKGDRVMPCFMQRWMDGPCDPEKARSALGGAVDGVLREYAVFNQDSVVRVPPFLTDTEAATLPCAAVTAWHALFENTTRLPGDTVLLLGTGGVSIFALQFAAAAGLRVIVTSSSDEKLSRAKQLGAAETINYKTTPEWDRAVRKLTADTGADHVIEVGGSGTIERSLRAVRMSGIVSIIGVLSGVQPSVSPVPILMNSLRLQGIFVGSRVMFERMTRFIELRQIRPVIDRVFPWTDTAEALRYMEKQQHFGKICLQF